MTTFDDRERAFENKFAKDEELKLRVLARRNRLLGEWAARLMGLTEAEADAYAKEVIRADFEEAGDEDVIRKLLGDLTAAGSDVDEAQIRRALDNKFVACTASICIFSMCPERVRIRIPCSCRTAGRARSSSSSSSSRGSRTRRASAQIRPTRSRSSRRRSRATVSRSPRARSGSGSRRSPTASPR